MHNGVNAIGWQIKKPMRFDHFKRLVHKRGAVDGDLGSHLPCWMIQRLLNCGVESVLAAPCAKWSAACCKNNARDFFLNAGAQALSKSAVLAVHWQQCHSSSFGGGCHKRAGRNQSFFICKRNGATHFNGGQSGGQAREANHGGHHNVARARDVLNKFQRGVGTAVHFVKARKLRGRVGI